MLSSPKQQPASRRFGDSSRMNLKLVRDLLVISIMAVVLALSATPGHAQRSKKAVILSINDVYRIEGVDDAKFGGMPRVRALRAKLEKAHPDLLFLHAGDFLGPSFLGRTYAGAQMIDLMNIMDGNPAVGTPDARMFVTFGNHEFDGSHCSKDGPLAKLVAASEFTWLTSNLDFNGCDKLRALVGSPNIAKNRVVVSGGLRIGLYALTLAAPDYAAVVSDPIAASCLQVAELRAKGVDAVVALTHLPWRTDLRLLGLTPDGNEMPASERSCAGSPDAIIGGHDHFNMSLPVRSPRLFKADADAQSAWVVELTRAGTAPVQVRGRLERLDHKRPADPMALRITNQWISQHDERFCLNECIGVAKDAVRKCRAAVENGQCLKEPFVRTTSVIETEEIVNRSFETGFGDWLTDQMRVAGVADVGFLNAGTLRLNYNLSAGTLLTRRHLEQMLPFKNLLIVRDVPGQMLWRAMEHAVARRGEGEWVHFSGMAVRLGGTDTTHKVAQILVRRRDGSRVEIGPNSIEPIRIAASSFVLANGDGHGFRLCPDADSVAKCVELLEADSKWPLIGEGADIAGLLRLKLREIDPNVGLKLSTDRRLCDRGQTGCLIDSW